MITSSQSRSARSRPSTHAHMLGHPSHLRLPREPEPTREDFNALRRDMTRLRREIARLSRTINRDPEEPAFWDEPAP